MSESDSVWKSVIRDAKDRNCFFNIEENKEFSKSVIEVNKELDQLEEVLDANSFLFKNARWKVHSLCFLTSTSINSWLLH